jgi:hypothetical protein
MTERAWLVTSIAAALAVGCNLDGAKPPLPLVTVFSPKPLDAVAYRNGDGPWRTLEQRDGQYTFQVHEERFSLALVCRSLGLAEVIHAAIGQVSAIHVPCGDPLDGFGLPETTHRWQGAIRGVGPGAQVSVSFGLHKISIPATVSGAGYEVGLRPAAHDLLAIAQEADGSARVIVKHHIDVTGPGTLDLDFGSADAVSARLLAHVLPAAAPGELLQAGLQITTWRGARGEVVSTTPGKLPELPGGVLSPDDVQEVWVRGVARDTVQLRQISVSLAGGEVLELALPDPLSGVSAALAASAPVVRPRVNFQPQPPVLFYQLAVAQLVPQQTVAWVVNASARWLGSGGNSLELPDLSGVAGFPPELGPPPGVPLQLELTAVTSTRSMDVLLDGLTLPGPGQSTASAKTVLSL